MLILVILSYLMLNRVFTYMLNIFDFVGLDLMAYQPLVVI